MTQEALKMGLEELAVRFSEGWHEGIKIDASDIMLLNEAAQALAQPEQEPVAWQWLGSAHFRKKLPKNADITAWNPLYTAPTQRKPLLASEIVTMYAERPTSDNDMIEFARAIEAAHGIKENT